MQSSNKLEKVIFFPLVTWIKSLYRPNYARPKTKIPKPKLHQLKPLTLAQTNNKKTAKKEKPWSPPCLLPPHASASTIPWHLHTLQRQKQTKHNMTKINNIFLIL
ncbi:hypothetical protein V6Z11_A07G138800 [Gossypium hirsutum]